MNSRRRQLYGVFAQGKWTMTLNKRQALQAAKRYRGEVRAMPYPCSDSWDAPTFRVCSDCIADFREVTR